MSSILKALKRIEPDTSRLEEPTYRWPTKLDVPRIVSARIRERWLYSRLAGGLLAALMIGCAVLLTVVCRPVWLVSALPGNSSLDPPVDRRLAELQPAAPSARSHAQDPPQSSSPQTTAKVRHTSAAKSKPSARTEREAKRETPRTAATLGLQTPVSAPDNGELTHSPAQTARPNAAGLKLEGIAWNQDPAQRVAIISGHVVKEGQSVLGFKVAGIRQDGVVLRDGARALRLQFDPAK